MANQQPTKEDLQKAVAGLVHTAELMAIQLGEALKNVSELLKQLPADWPQEIAKLNYDKTLKDIEGKNGKRRKQ